MILRAVGRISLLADSRGKRRALFRVNLNIGRQMNPTVEIPDDLAARLNVAGGDLSRRALEL
jgi:hypothetical protein